MESSCVSNNSNSRLAGRLESAEVFAPAVNWSVEVSGAIVKPTGYRPGRM